MKHKDYFPQKGITLMEILVALLVLSILIGLGAPSLADYIHKKRLQGAAERIYSDLRMAQSESILRNIPVYVSFNNTTENWCYGINENEVCDCNQPSSCKLGAKFQTVSRDLFNGVKLQKARFAGGTSYTVFDPRNGFAIGSGAKNGSIWLKSQNETQMAIVVNRIGRIRFCSPTLDEYSNKCPTAPN